MTKQSQKHSPPTGSCKPSLLLSCTRHSGEFLNWWPTYSYSTLFYINTVWTIRALLAIRCISGWKTSLRFLPFTLSNNLYSFLSLPLSPINYTGTEDIFKKVFRNIFFISVAWRQYNNDIYWPHSKGIILSCKTIVGFCHHFWKHQERYVMWRSQF